MGGTKESKIVLEIVEHSPSVAARLRRRGTQLETLFLSQNMEELGYPSEDFLCGRRSLRDIVHPDDWQNLWDTMEHHERHGIDEYTLSFRMRKPSGETLWLSGSTAAVRDTSGQVMYWDCLLSNHTQIVERQRLVEQNLQHQQVMNDILQVLHTQEMEDLLPIMLERAGRHLGLSRVVLFENMAGGKSCRVACEWVDEGVAPLLADGECVLPYRDMPDIETGLQMHGKLLVRHGEIPLHCAPLFERQGILSCACYAVHLGNRPYGFLRFDECRHARSWPEDALGFLENISKLVNTALLRKGNEESIRRMAYSDQLTGLTNRYRFDMYLQRAVDEAAAAGKEGYVLFVDMDDFKVINEGYGHDYGDAMLIAVAEFLQQNYADVSRLFRFGGDEFVVLVDFRHASTIQSIIDGILARARHPWGVMGREFYCTTSIGVVRFPDGEAGATDIIKNADIALYQAKSQGKNSYVIYDRNLTNDSQQRAETEHKMRDAIDNAFQGFQVHYQPVVDLQGEVLSAEALVRWTSADGSMMPPGDFIPLAEYLGLIVPLGEFVLREAALECRRINERYPRFMMHVNVSIRQFQQPDFLTRVEEILRGTGVDTSNIVLEVTEGMLVQDIEHMQIMAEELRGMGLKMAMDDFGTGYSSLNNMRQLPLDIIKIDRSFIHDVTSDDYAKNFVRLISDLAHSMGRQVCVEGVETAAQYRYCVECHVDTIQGFYFHRPMPAAQMRQLLFGSEAPKPVPHPLVERSIRIRGAGLCPEGV